MKVIAINGSPRKNWNAADWSLVLMDGQAKVRDKE